MPKKGSPKTPTLLGSQRHIGIRVRSGHQVNVHDVHTHNKVANSRRHVRGKSDDGKRANLGHYQSSPSGVKTYSHPYVSKGKPYPNTRTSYNKQTAGVRQPVRMSNKYVSREIQRGETSSLKKEGSSTPPEENQGSTTRYDLVNPPYHNSESFDCRFSAYVPHHDSQKTGIPNTRGSNVSLPVGRQRVNAERSRTEDIELTDRAQGCQWTQPTPMETRNINKETYHITNVRSRENKPAEVHCFDQRQEGNRFANSRQEAERHSENLQDGVQDSHSKQREDGPRDQMHGVKYYSDTGHHTSGLRKSSPSVFQQGYANSAQISQSTSIHFDEEKREKTKRNENLPDRWLKGTSSFNICDVHSNPDISQRRPIEPVNGLIRGNHHANLNDTRQEHPCDMQPYTMQREYGSPHAAQQSESRLSDKGIPEGQFLNISCPDISRLEHIVVDINQGTNGHLDETQREHTFRDIRTAETKNCRSKKEHFCDTRLLENRPSNISCPNVSLLGTAVHDISSESSEHGDNGQERQRIARSRPSGYFARNTGRNTPPGNKHEQKGNCDFGRDAKRLADSRLIWTSCPDISAPEIAVYDIDQRGDDFHNEQEGLTFPNNGIREATHYDRPQGGTGRSDYWQQANRCHSVRQFNSPELRENHTTCDNYTKQERTSSTDRQVLYNSCPDISRLAMSVQGGLSLPDYGQQEAGLAGLIQPETDLPDIHSLELRSFYTKENEAIGEEKTNSSGNSQLKQSQSNDPYSRNKKPHHRDNYEGGRSQAEIRLSKTGTIHNRPYLDSSTIKTDVCRPEKKQTVAGTFDGCRTHGTDSRQMEANGPDTDSRQTGTGGPYSDSRQTEVGGPSTDSRQIEAGGPSTDSRQTEGGGRDTDRRQTEVGSRGSRQIETAGPDIRQTKRKDSAQPSYIPPTLLKEEHCIKVTSIIMPESSPILIHGNGGCGKTALAHWTRDKWSNGHVATHHDVFCLIDVDSISKSQTKVTLGQFLIEHSDCKMGTDRNRLFDFAKDNSKRMIVWFDCSSGILPPPYFRKKMTMSQPDVEAEPLKWCWSILHGDVLQESYKIITTRPVSNISYLQPRCHLELVGFTSEDIQAFIKSNVPAEKRELISFTILNDPFFVAICKNPFWCNKLCSLLQKETTDPITYTMIAAFLVQELFTRHGLDVRSDDLLQQYARMAAMTLVKQQKFKIPFRILLYYNAVVGNPFKKDAKKTDLLNFDWQRDELKEPNYSGYIAQEILGIASLLSHDVDIQTLLASVPYTARLFVYGISLSVDNEWTEWITKIMGVNRTKVKQEVKKNLFEKLKRMDTNDVTIQIGAIRTAYESQDESVAKAVGEMLAPDNRLKLSGIPLTALDVRALSYVMSHVKRLKEVELINVGIKDYKLTILQDFLAGQPSLEILRVATTDPVLELTICPGDDTDFIETIKRGEKSATFRYKDDLLSQLSICRLRDMIANHSSLRFLDFDEPLGETHVEALLDFSKERQTIREIRCRAFNKGTSACIAVMKMEEVTQIMDHEEETYYFAQSVAGGGRIQFVQQAAYLQGYLRNFLNRESLPSGIDAKDRKLVLFPTNDKMFKIEMKMDILMNELDVTFKDVYRVCTISSAIHITEEDGRGKYRPGTEICFTDEHGIYHHTTCGAFLTDSEGNMYVISSFHGHVPESCYLLEELPSTSIKKRHNCKVVAHVYKKTPLLDAVLIRIDDEEIKANADSFLNLQPRTTGGKKGLCDYFTGPTEDLHTTCTHGTMVIKHGAATQLTKGRVALYDFEHPRLGIYGALVIQPIAPRESFSKAGDSGSIIMCAVPFEHQTPQVNGEFACHLGVGMLSHGITGLYPNAKCSLAVRLDFIIEFFRSETKMDLCLLSVDHSFG